MAQMTKESLEGDEIAKRIRKALLGIDLRITYAKAQYDVAEAAMSLYSSLPKTKANIRKTLRAKMEMECYSNYLDALMRHKESVNQGLSAVMDRYYGSELMRKVWIGYFLQSRTVEEIADEINYTRRSVDYFIRQMRNDLALTYELVRELKDAEKEQIPGNGG